MTRRDDKEERMTSQHDVAMRAWLKAVARARGK
jgi:hypothetical protein